MRSPFGPGCAGRGSCCAEDSLTTCTCRVCVPVRDQISAKTSETGSTRLKRGQGEPSTVVARRMQSASLRGPATRACSITDLVLAAWTRRSCYAADGAPRSTRPRRRWRDIRRSIATSGDWPLGRLVLRLVFLLSTILGPPCAAAKSGRPTGPPTNAPRWARNRQRTHEPRAGTPRARIA